MAVAKKATADSPKAKGRPPLRVIKTTVRLTPETIARIEKVAGPNRLATFVREAVDRELARREAEQ